MVEQVSEEQGACVAAGLTEGYEKGTASAQREAETRGEAQKRERKRENSIGAGPCCRGILRRQIPLLPNPRLILKTFRREEQGVMANHKNGRLYAVSGTTFFSHASRSACS